MRHAAEQARPHLILETARLVADAATRPRPAVSSSQTCSCPASVALALDGLAPTRHPSPTSTITPGIDVEARERDRHQTIANRQWRECVRQRLGGDHHIRNLEQPHDSRCLDVRTLVDVAQASAPQTASEPLGRARVPVSARTTHRDHPVEADKATNRSIDPTTTSGVHGRARTEHFARPTSRSRTGVGFPRRRIEGPEQEGRAIASPGLRRGPR